MASPVTVKGSFDCAHGGTAKLADAPGPVSDGRLTVGTGAVALFSAVGHVGPYDGWKLNPPPPPPQADNATVPASAATILRRTGSGVFEG